MYVFVIKFKATFFFIIYILVSPINDIFVVVIMLECLKECLKSAKDDQTGHYTTNANPVKSKLYVMNVPNK